MEEPLETGEVETTAQNQTGCRRRAVKDGLKEMTLSWEEAEMAAGDRPGWGGRTATSLFPQTCGGLSE